MISARARRVERRMIINQKIILLCMCDNNICGGIFFYNLCRFLNKSKAHLSKIGLKYAVAQQDILYIGESGFYDSGGISVLSKYINMSSTSALLCILYRVSGFHLINWPVCVHLPIFILFNCVWSLND